MLFFCNSGPEFINFDKFVDVFIADHQDKFDDIADLNIFFLDQAESVNKFIFEVRLDQNADKKNKIEILNIFNDENLQNEALCETPIDLYQGSTLKALNFFEDYLILFDRSPPQGKYEADSAYQHRLKLAVDRKKHAQKSKRDMRQILAESKVEIGKYVENYGKYFILRWKELGNKPALQFYNEAITTAPESEAARVAEQRVAALRSGDD